MTSPTIRLPPIDVTTPPEFRRLVTAALLWEAQLMGHITLQQQCMVSAVAAVLAAADFNQPSLFQAGSLQWRAVRPDLDDGVSSTHMSFMWEPEHPLSTPQYLRIKSAVDRADRDPSFRMTPGSSLLPEVHCWSAWPDRGLVVDLTSGKLPDVCKGLGQLRWTMPLPPTYFFGNPDGDTCRYIPNQEATVLLFKFARLLLRDAPFGVEQRFTNHVLATAQQVRTAAVI